MKSKGFNYRLDELILDMQEIYKLLGYPDSVLPIPFDAYLEEAIKFAYQQTDICASYTIVEKVLIEEKQGIVLIEGLALNIGKTLAKELRGSEKLAFFVCTAGESISKMASTLLKGEDTVRGYVYDLLGTYIVEAACDRMQISLKEEFLSLGFQLSNRYSPGYCHWDVSEQHKLFSFFSQAPCGVTLTPSALMSPVKSISGVIGIGHQVKYREYQCELCSMKNCIYKKL